MLIKIQGLEAKRPPLHQPSSVDEIQPSLRWILHKNIKDESIYPHIVKAVINVVSFVYEPVSSITNQEVFPDARGVLGVVILHVKNQYIHGMVALLTFKILLPPSW